MDTRNIQKENICEALQSVTEWHNDLCQLVDGNIEGIPSWMSYNQSIISVCNSLITNLQYIKKQMRSL